MIVLLGREGFLSSDGLERSLKELSCESENRIMQIRKRVCVFV